MSITPVVVLIFVGIVVIGGAIELVVQLFFNRNRQAFRDFRDRKKEDEKVARHHAKLRRIK